MSVLIALIPFGFVGVLYVWYLRLATRWTLNVSLSRKLAWLFFTIVFIGAMLVRAFLAPEGSTIQIIAGVCAHFALGTYFFGTFAVDENKNPPGITGGAKITAIAMGLLLATISVVFYAVETLRSNLPTS